MTQKRTIKAWAVIRKSNGEFISMERTKENAIYSRAVSFEGMQKGVRIFMILPCTITYTLPKKVKNKKGK